MPGPDGPICASCIAAGLKLVHDGQARPSRGETVLVRVTSRDDEACEFCERRERYTFLGFRRSLARMKCPELGAVICADCLDHGGDLINKAYRH